METYPISHPVLQHARQCPAAARPLLVHRPCLSWLISTGAASLAHASMQQEVSTWPASSWSPLPPAPTISQSTASTGVRPWVSAMASGAFGASSGSAASRRLFLLPPGAIWAFRAAQLALIFVPAQEHTSRHKSRTTPM